MKRVGMLVLLAMASQAGFAQGPPAGGPPGGGDMMAVIKGIFETCAVDTKQSCSGKEGPEALGCLIKQKDSLSKPCADALSKLPPPPNGGPPAGGAPPPKA